MAKAHTSRDDRVDGGRARRRPGRPLAAVGLALGLVLAAVVPAAAAADPDMSAEGAADRPVAVPQAGTFVGWGIESEAGELTVPESLSGVALRELAMASNTTLALTADGRVVAWGYDTSGVHQVPADIAGLGVVDIAASMTNAGVVTSTGAVRVWGKQSSGADPTDVPVAAQSGVTQLAVEYQNAFALKTDGSVVAWGKEHLGLTTPPAGLQATAIAAAGTSAFALRTNGTVAGWGDWRVQGTPSDPATLPAATQIPGNVTAVAAVNHGAVALLADGSIVAWGHYGSQSPPDLGGRKAVAIAGGPGTTYLVLDEDGVFHVGGFGADDAGLAPPPATEGLPVAQFAAGALHYGVIVTALMRARDPVVSGLAQVGSVLTATPGTFSGAPDAIGGQWLAGGTPIPGASGTTLSVGADLLGKTISYRSTATKGGDEVSSTSTATAPVAPAPSTTQPKGGSSVAVGKVAVAKKAKKLTVNARVAAAAPAGQAMVTILKGKKVILSQAVAVTPDGNATLVVKKFNKRAKKVLKVTAKTFGKYKISIEYSGSSVTEPSAGSGSFKVKKR